MASLVFIFRQDWCVDGWELFEVMVVQSDPTESRTVVGYAGRSYGAVSGTLVLVQPCPEIQVARISPLLRSSSRLTLLTHIPQLYPPTLRAHKAQSLIRQGPLRRRCLGRARRQHALGRGVGETNDVWAGVLSEPVREARRDGVVA